MKKIIYSLFFALLTSLTCLNAASNQFKVIAATDTSFYKDKYVWSYSSINLTVTSNGLNQAKITLQEE